MSHREIGHASAEEDAPTQAALEAARLLERVCREFTDARDEDRRSLYLGSVAGLARDLGGELESLPHSPEAMVSAALRAADLATLAACALPELPPQSPESHRVAAAVHLASGATRSLGLMHKALAGDGPDDYAAYDLRGAAWRASLAARQADEALQTEP